MWINRTTEGWLFRGTKRKTNGQNFIKLLWKKNEVSFWCSNGFIEPILEVVYKTFSVTFASPPPPSHLTIKMVKFGKCHCLCFPCSQQGSPLRTIDRAWQTKTSLWREHTIQQHYTIQNNAAQNKHVVINSFSKWHFFFQNRRLLYINQWVGVHANWEAGLSLGTLTEDTNQPWMNRARSKNEEDSEISN